MRHDTWMTIVLGRKDVQSSAFQLLSHACSRDEMWSICSVCVVTHCAHLYMLFEWVFCSLFLVMLEAATDEEHGPAAMRVVALRESTVVADEGPAFWARVGKSTGLIVIWWPSGRLGCWVIVFGRV